MRSSLEIAQDAELAPIGEIAGVLPDEPRALRASQGEGVAVASRGPRMPGLGPKPAAIDVTIDADGRTVGLF